MRPRSSPGRAYRRHLQLVERPGRRRARGKRRAVRAVWPRRAAAAARLRRGSDPPRSGRAGTSPWHDPTRPAGRRRRSRAAATLPAMHRLAACWRRLPARGGLGRAGRARAPPIAPGTRRPPGVRLARGRARQTAPARGRRPHQALRARARDARLGDRGRARDRWLPPAPDVRLGVPRSVPTGRSLSAAAGGETRPEVRSAAARPPPLEPARQSLFQAPPPRGRAAPAHPSGRPRPRATGAVSRPATAAHAAQSSLRSAPAATRRQGGQTRPPAARGTIRVEALAAQADCHVSRRVSGLGRAHPEERRRPTRAAPAQKMSGNPPRASSGSPANSSTPPESRSANRRTTDSAASRRATKASTCAEDLSSHWTSSTRQTSGASSAAPDSRPRTARPTRNRSGGAPELRPNAVATASLVAPATVLDDPGVLAQSCCRPRTEAPSPIPPQLREGSDSPLRAPPRSPAGTICLFRARLEAPTPRSVPTALRPAADRASRTPSRGLPTRPSRAELRQLPSRRQNISGPELLGS